MATISRRFLAGFDTAWQIAKISGGGGLLPFFKNICTQQNNLTFHYKFLNTNVIFTAEPANYRAVFATDFKSFELPSTRLAALRPVLGESVFSQNGGAWRHSRGLLRPWFAPRYTSDLEAMEANLQLMLEQLPCSGESTGETDLYLAFGAFAITILWAFSLGRLLHLGHGTKSAQQTRKRWGALSTRGFYYWLLWPSVSGLMSLSCQICSNLLAPKAD